MSEQNPLNETTPATSSVPSRIPAAFRGGASKVKAAAASKRAKVVAASVLALALVAGGTTAAVAGAQTNHSNIVAEFKASDSEYDKAVKAAKAALTAHEEAKAAQVEFAAAVAPVVTVLEGYVAEDARLSINDSRATLVTATEAVVTDPLASKFKEPKLSFDDAPNDEIVAGGDAVAKETARIVKATQVVSDSTDALTSARSAVDDALVYAAGLVPETANQVVAANPDAEQASRDAVTAAVTAVATAVTEEKPVSESLTAYVAAAKALQDANAAAVAVKNNADTYVAPDGTVKTAPKAPSNGNGGNSGNGGNGGNGGGGTAPKSNTGNGGGGSTTPPKSNTGNGGGGGSAPAPVNPPAPVTPPAPVAPPAPTLNAAAKASSLAGQYGGSTSVGGNCAKINYGTISANSSFAPSSTPPAPGYNAVKVWVEGSGYGVQWYNCRG